MEKRAQRRRPIHDWYRARVRPLFSKRLSALAAAALPAVYVAYMRLVWRTSRIEGLDEFRLVERTVDANDGAIALLWHEEVFTTAWAYAAAGLAPHTLASPGDAGELITRCLERCGFVVFRGGTTSSRSRRREGVAEAMIGHMKDTPKVLYGITVDGSKGPAYRMKSGGPLIARECDKPVVLVRCWYRRCLRLPTWDRMAVPLPFNVIRYWARGPFPPPADASDRRVFLGYRNQLEHDLIELARESYAHAGQAIPENLVYRRRGRTDRDRGPDQEIPDGP